MNERVAATPYALKTAGQLMEQSVPRVLPDDTIGSCLSYIQNSVSSFSTIDYLYVCTEAGTLIGVLSIRELFSVADHAQKVQEVMISDVIVAHKHDDQETVARLAVRNNIKAIPVVDTDVTLLGVFTTDTILRVLNEETTEDFLRLAGLVSEDSSAKSLITATATTHIKQRLPWLLIGMTGGLLAAVVVGQFEAVLEEHVAIAAFIPLIVYLADAIGSQIQIIFIRSLALRPDLSIFSYVWREVRVNIVLGLVLSLCIGVVSYLWRFDVWLSAVLMIAVLATTVAAVCIAMALPWLFLKTHRDPAVGSGPSATVLIDIISLLIYFVVASLLLGL